MAVASSSSTSVSFLSTPSARRATRLPPKISVVYAFLSTPSARRATCDFGLVPVVFLFLSTPSARRATMMPIRNRRRRGFLSTPSARRATTERPAIGRHGKNFYPRPPRGGRRVPTGAGSARRNFYPRPPRGGRLQRVINCIQLFQFLSTPSARRATAKTETKSLFSYKLYNILHEFRRALIYNGSKNDPNHAKRHKNPVRRCRKNAENSPFAPGRKTQNNSRPSCSKGG